MEEWIWIAIGIILSLVLFSIFYVYTFQANIAKIEQKSFEQFYELADIVNDLCLLFSGNKREYKMIIAESVEGIYSTNDPNREYNQDELINKIISGEISLGDYICMKVKDKRLKCKKLNCNLIIPYLGYVPEKYSLSELVNKISGKGNFKEQQLYLLRDIDNVLASDKLVSPLCGNGVIDPGEACEPKDSQDNSNCPQTIAFCDYTNRKYCTRDEFGRCNTFCACKEDSWICGSEDDNNYCNNCQNHCGDGVCNCNENSATCSIDCQPAQGACNLDDVIKEISGASAYSFMEYLATKPRPAEGWGVDTSWNKHTRDWIKQKLEEFGLKNVRIHQFSYDGNKGFNVLGELGDGDEVIVIGAHRDSCGNDPLCQLTQGAVDNAAGSSVILELARVISKKCSNKIKNYKFLFAFFDSEELRLLGSKAYVNHYGVKDVVAMMNFDCHQAFYKQDGSIIERSSLEMDKTIDFCVNKVGLKMYGKTDNRCGYPCSDHWPFRLRGVPTLFPTGYPGHPCGDYYHTPRDTPDTVKKENLEITAKFAACFLLKLFGS